MDIHASQHGCPHEKDCIRAMGLEDVHDNQAYAGHPDEIRRGTAGPKTSANLFGLLSPSLTSALASKPMEIRTPESLQKL